MATTTHAVDLVPNRHDEIGFPELRRMFGEACFKLDQCLLQCRNVQFWNSHHRLRMIALPEKLTTNPHLHCFGDFSEAFWGNRLRQVPWEVKLETIWEEVTAGSGSVRITDNFDRGAAVYRTKEALRHNHEYLHSWDFHRDDKLPVRPSWSRHQRRPAVRKSRTHQ